MCSLLGQASGLGLGSPILPVLASCPAGKNASLPFKLRHKASNNGPVANSGSSNGILGEHRRTPQHDSDASSDSSMTVPQLSSSIESTGAFVDVAGRESACSPVSVLKTENYALKSELQRLASEVATLKNVLVYSSQSVAAGHALKMSADRCNLYQPGSPATGNHSPMHYPDDLVDRKVLLSNVIQFQKLNDIIV